MIALLAMAALSEPSYQIWNDVDPARLRATVEKLSSFSTRNSASSQLKEACQWIADEFRKIPGLQVELMEFKLPGGRGIVKDTPSVQVIATLPGKTNRTLLIGGHIDSLNLNGDPYRSKAPGANDDASGVSLTLEAARILAKHQWDQTIKFVAFSGEEQGLVGSTELAKRAKAENWLLEAVLNNDTVGSSSNKLGQSDNKRIRVFSEETSTHKSRELARFAQWVVAQSMKDFGVKLVYRRDRFGRGGDHTPFANQGYNAVRFVEVHEEYSRQHTVDDLIEHMDFDYLANVAKANVAILASLGKSAVQPTSVRIVRDQSHDTTVQWSATAGVSYVIYWRETTSPVWQGHFDVGAVNRAKIDRINKDDHIFAVGAVGGLPVEAE